MTSMPSLTELALAPSQSDHAVLAPLRREAQAALEGGLTWPNPKTAAWRHTKLLRLAQHAWAAPESQASVDAAELSALVPDLDLTHHRLVLVDGLPAWGLCHLPLAESGSYVADLCEGLGSRPELLVHLDMLGRRQLDGLIALNVSRAHHGALVHIRRSTQASTPLHIIYLHTTATAPSLLQPRTLVVMEAQAQATVFETHVGQGDGPAWVNAATDLIVGPDAHLRYAMRQAETAQASHLHALSARLERNGTLEMTTMDEGAALGRRSLEVMLAESGANAHLTHITLGHREQHLDTQSVIRHLAAQTHCTQAYRSVLGGHSTGIFNGMIDIVPQAQKITAQQMSRGLLTSPGAQAIVKPQMLILADDVKCTHGATVGQLDEDAYFYLVSRGIAPATARHMLTFAFLADALTHLHASLKAPLVEAICRGLGADRAIAHPVSLTV